MMECPLQGPLSLSLLFRSLSKDPARMELNKQGRTARRLPPPWTPKHMAGRIPTYFDMYNSGE